MSLSAMVSGFYSSQFNTIKKLLKHTQGHVKSVFLISSSMGETIRLTWYPAKDIQYTKNIQHFMKDLSMFH